MGLLSKKRTKKSKSEESGIEYCYAPPSDKDPYVYASAAEQREADKRLKELMDAGMRPGLPTEDVYYDAEGRLRRRARLVKLRGEVEFKGKEEESFNTVVIARALVFLLALCLVSMAFTVPIGILAAVVSLMVPNEWYRDKKKPHGS